MPRQPIVPRWQVRLYLLTVFALALTGTAQMPLYKRYYVTDISVLSWLGDFYATHALHYVLASVFLVLTFRLAVLWLGRWKARFHLDGWGWTRVACVALIIVTGLLRTLKNLPDLSFGPLAVLLFDWLHMAGAMLYGLAAIGARVAGKGTYLRSRK